MGIRLPNKADQVYELLRHSIVLLKIPSGSPNVERDLCADFGISRTPVREALQRPAEEDHVDAITHSGTYVSRISYEVAEEGFVVRRALAIESVRRAALNCATGVGHELDAILARMRRLIETDRLYDSIDEDDTVHAALARLSGLPRIWKFITLAKVHLDRMRQMSAPVPGHHALVTGQHATIVAAIHGCNPAQAELAMRIHLESSFDVMARLNLGSTGMFSTKAP